MKKRWWHRLINWIARKLLELNDPVKHWRPLIKAADKRLEEQKRRVESCSIEEFVERAKQEPQGDRVTELDEGEAELRKELGMPKDMAKTGFMFNDRK